MKQSDMTVSMPMTTYKQIEKFLSDYESLKNELQSCINTQLFDSGVSNILHFDTKKALEICRKLMPIKYDGIDVSVDV